MKIFFEKHIQNGLAFWYGRYKYELLSGGIRTKQSENRWTRFLRDPVKPFKSEKNVHFYTLKGYFGHPTTQFYFQHKVEAWNVLFEAMKLFLIEKIGWITSGTKLPFK